ncbi:inositol monophosphatase family protein [Limibacterium fermenti]|uniref:inositol monophosphatase family protein n=1 Tax=Limibacterium fermenti TaxID=3229863 RepID=UPI000E8F25D8|nr:inositol monophosphatase [Porphyromonadaceae bacterium]
MSNDIEVLCGKVAQIAVSTGEFLKIQQAKLHRSDIEFKGVRNYVTHIDKEAEQQLVKELGALLPEASFLTEEGTVEYQKERYTWIIDPLDGTTNYIHGDKPFSVSIGLKEDDKIILGIVYDPVAEEMFSATGKDTAQLNGKPISVSNHPSLNNGYIGFGIPYSLDEKGEQILKNAFAQFRQCSFRIKGSAAIEICSVAMGRSDAYFHSGLSPWDVAAGSFILKCAGGTCTDFSGGENYLFGKELVASNGAIHREILQGIITTL